MSTSWRLYDDTRDEGRVLIQRAIIEAVQQQDSMQRVRARGLAQTQNDRIEHIQPVGFTSNPGGGDKIEALIMDLIGDGTHRVALAIMGDRKRTLQVGSGAAALYAPGNRDAHVMTTPDEIIINAPNIPVRIVGAQSVTIQSAGTLTLDAPLVHMTGDLNVDGAISRLTCPCC